ncbi:class I SAM-dependent DNA methyltransferase [Alkalimonas mucilaginosa]|uniref:Class I SAM-dependent methyltransferase n=1 Tax=Alkalimonas mucilaginosa TaxID=3057676 RepID=A0ABU7JI28_9GAMM|nr:class I SAM-dependent methyltransferase [Alkalimonas sp. MEB004]MEE2025363.1 class I SAM-dependent methyltransferase [Alkalimonas sp. MEB004]
MEQIGQSDDKNIQDKLQPAEVIIYPESRYELVVINPPSGDNGGWAGFIDFLMLPLFLLIFYFFSARKLSKETKKLNVEATKLQAEGTKLEAEVKSIEETLRQNKLAFQEQLNSVRRAEIKDQLKNFFAPFKSLRIQSINLYLLFATQEKAEAKINRKAMEEKLRSEGKVLDRKELTPEQISQCYFGTVRHFIDGKTFEKHDKAILKQIILVGDRLLELISKDAFILKNTSLHGILGEYAAHVTALKLASEGYLEGNARASELSMPLEIDGAIESAIMALEKEYQSLMPNYKEQSPTLSSAELETVNYYDQNALSYFDSTITIDLQDIYGKFREHLPSTAYILDAGCGVGRDTRYFIQVGYKVRSFDASAEMVKFCNQYPFAFCEHRAFADVTELEEYDGIWASASLLHLNQESFKQALLRLSFALKVGGIMYFSLKAEADESNTKDSRQFYYHARDFVEAYIKTLNLEAIEIWSNPGRKVGAPSQFINYLLKKSSRVTSPETRSRNS